MSKRKNTRQVRTIRSTGALSTEAKAGAKAAAGAERAAFFAAGGTPQMWKGTARTFDKGTKAARNKRACR